MKVQVEGIICNWADEIPNVIVRVINAISIAENKEELQTALLQISQETELDKFFVYGYGAHHFWLTHRRLSNGEPMEHRFTHCCNFRKYGKEKFTEYAPNTFLKVCLR